MRIRIAVLATAINIVLSVAIALVCVENAQIQIDEICRLSANAPDSAAFSKFGIANVVHPVAGIIALSAIIEFAVIAFVIKRSNSTVSEGVKTMESFSNGEYDSRAAVPGAAFSGETERFNLCLSHMQDKLDNLRRRNHAVNMVMNQMQNGIIAVDAEQRVILVTPVAKELLGIKGNCEGMLVTEASKDVRLDEVFSEAMRQEDGIYTNEVAARTDVGRGHRPLRLYVSVMRQDERAVGALALVEDITKIRMLEQVRTDFAANVSHELKTPLTSIKGFVETLMNGAVDNHDMALKFLNIIMLEADRLTRLINDILSISKLESGEDNLPIESIRIDKLAREVVEMLEIHASEKQVALTAYTSEAAYVMGNHDRVEQMLINLVENAIKYNRPEGLVSVRVMSANGQVNISVADTGIGIAEEHLPRLFERFYRVDKGRSRSMGGTGLGLAIVKHIVISMNGLIEVHSKLGEGTEFLITLPACEPPKTQDDDFDDGFSDDFGGDEN